MNLGVNFGVEPMTKRLYPDGVAAPQYMFALSNIKRILNGIAERVRVCVCRRIVSVG